MFEPNSFLYTFDLKSAYHHIDIYTEHTTYLGFSIKENGIDKYFVYNSLPFGIASAGHIFTKTHGVAIKMWRRNGKRVIMFLDDGIGGDKNYETALKSSRYVRESLNELGFLLAIYKCVWKPTMVVIWLGHILNFNVNRLFITEDRIMRLENTVRSILFQIMKRQAECSSGKIFSISCWANHIVTIRLWKVSKQKDKVLVQMYIFKG